MRPALWVIEQAGEIRRDALPARLQGLLDATRALALLQVGRLDAAREVVQDMAEHPDPWTRVQGARRACDLAWLAGDHERAVPLGEEAVAMARELGDAVARGGALRTLAAAMSEAGDLSRSETTIHEALELFEQLGDRQAMGVCARQLSAAARLRGDLPTALEYAERSAALVRSPFSSGPVLPTCRAPNPPLRRLFFSPGSRQLQANGRGCRRQPS